MYKCNFFSYDFVQFLCLLLFQLLVIWPNSVSATIILKLLSFDNFLLFSRKEIRELVNWRIRGFVFWCQEQAISNYLIFTAAAAQAKCSFLGGAWTVSSNRTKRLSLAVYQFRNRISVTVSGVGNIKSNTEEPLLQLDVLSSNCKGYSFSEFLISPVWI